MAIAAWHIAAMSRADLSPPRRTRLGVVLLVAALHVAVVLALIRAFAPSFSAQVVDRVTAVFTVEVSPPDPPPPAQQPEPAGAAGEAGRKAVPRPVMLPKPPIVIAKPAPAPPIAGKGPDVSAGARDSGSGTGAGGQGSGTGSGSGGGGTGGGKASKSAKIAGDINTARDYPKKSRALRLGDYVIVALTVGTDGRVKACRVHRPSRDGEADAITCRLATDRFRFRPASDVNGNPVESTYGWKQQWFDPKTSGADADKAGEKD
jgi:protein TonB